MTARALGRCRIRRRATNFGYSPAEREGAEAWADCLTVKKPVDVNGPASRK
jgi:hypothetical protein